MLWEMVVPYPDAQTTMKKGEPLRLAPAPKLAPARNPLSPPARLCDWVSAE